MKRTNRNKITIDKYLSKNRLALQVRKSHDEIQIIFHSNLKDINEYFYNIRPIQADAIFICSRFAILVDWANFM